MFKKFLIFFILQIIQTKEINDTTLIYDYCSIEDSFIATKISKEINTYYGDYFDNNNQNCLFLKEKFFSYENQFNELYLKSGHLNIKCPKCEKTMKNKELLLMHYKLFHMKTSNEVEFIVCPADLCLFLNCKRYKSYFDRVKVNVQEREIICEKGQESFYRKGCLSLFKNCLKKEENELEKNIEISYDFYNNFCSKIECEQTETRILDKPSSFLEVMRLLFMYMFGVFTLIYVLIIWVSHYQ